MEKQKTVSELRAALEDLDIATLRSKASKNFGLKISRQHTKEDLVNLIASALEKSDYAGEADGELKPGWARIKVHYDSNKARIPIFTNTNGYSCFIPPGVEVDVPIKVLETLDHAQEIRKVQNDTGEYVDSFEDSYPYQLIATNPGPDPRPGIEVSRERKWQSYKDFYKKYKYWPSWKAMQQAMAATVKFNPWDSTAEE